MEATGGVLDRRVRSIGRGGECPKLDLTNRTQIALLAHDAGIDGERPR
jgi:hypothetical protein